MAKNEIKVKLSSVSLASELRDLKKEDYDELIQHLKGYDKYRSSRNPQEKAMVMAADNSISILKKNIQKILHLEENKKKIESLYDEIFDKNEMRSKNAIAEVWSLFNNSALSEDTALKAKIWEHFSKRILMPETSPHIRAGIAKIFGDFNEPRAVPILLKFKGSNVHVERLAIDEALKKITETFSKDEIVKASTNKEMAETKPVGPAAEPEGQTAGPAAEPVAEPAPKEDIPDKEKGPYKILIVDDALVMRNLYSRMLKESGYITDIAKNGIETFEKIKSNEYDILLLDLKLPDVDGIEILKKVPEVTMNKNMKVIIISSYLNEDNKRKAMDLDAAAVLAKPIDIDMLSSKIKIIMR
jgi:CheY-like chemotaxis protein